MERVLMTSPLEALEPRTLWQHFDAIRQIPRPSRREEKILAHIQGWAAERGFETRSDAASNLVVLVPASSGREAAATILLQSHVDMVCEKNTGVEHDFDRDPIAVAVDGDWVRALGTTLGADNGIGVATAMAAADDPAIVHGPLELLFTVDEETGLNGAGDLDPAIVTSRLLLNLDSEEDNAVYIGCAGAGSVDVTLSAEREAAPAASEIWELALTGLAGGHSGVDADRPRASAIKLMVHLLLELGERQALPPLVAFRGGSARNALPRECFATLALDDAPAFRRQVTAFHSELTERYPLETELQLVLRPAAEAAPPAPSLLPLRADCRDRLLHALAAAHHGILTMSHEVPGLVETSNNLALVHTDADAVHVICCPRSSSNAALAETLRSLKVLFLLAGADAKSQSDYPGWQPNPASPLLARTTAVYEELFGAPPEVKAVHAGLECGILAEKLPGLDAVSIGPDVLDPHSPDEKVRISSVKRFYRFLSRLLDDLSAT
jgi:dipeptidase D